MEKPMTNLGILEILETGRLVLNENNRNEITFSRENDRGFIEIKRNLQLPAKT
jgi:hypothetical protein